MIKSSLGFPQKVVKLGCQIEWENVIFGDAGGVEVPEVLGEAVAKVVVWAVVVNPARRIVEMNVESLRTAEMSAMKE